MLKRIIALVMSLAILSATTFVFAEDVYITKRGKKYHKQDCPLIANKDAQKVNLEEAKAKGLEPCKRCFKSAKTQTKQKVQKSAKAKKQDLVYVTASGKKYHREDCRLIKNRKTTGISLADAQGRGLQPCSRCFLKEAKSE
ncbi:MAG: hypothetical protein ISS45_03660 [Candidatus Omnitrophica bacterium]|nr:hypothetical protein [Candidatus Omnitrophota bacterium]